MSAVTITPASEITPHHPRQRWRQHRGPGDRGLLPGGSASSSCSAAAARLGLVRHPHHLRCRVRAPCSRTSRAAPAQNPAVTPCVVAYAAQASRTGHDPHTAAMAATSAGAGSSAVHGRSGASRHAPCWDHRSGSRGEVAAVLTGPPPFRRGKVEGSRGGGRCAHPNGSAVTSHPAARAAASSSACRRSPTRATTPDTSAASRSTRTRSRWRRARTGRLIESRGAVMSWPASGPCAGRGACVGCGACGACGSRGTGRRCRPQTRPARPGRPAPARRGRGGRSDGLTDPRGVARGDVPDEVVGPEVGADSVHRAVFVDEVPGARRGGADPVRGGECGHAVPQDHRHLGRGPQP